MKTKTKKKEVEVVVETRPKCKLIGTDGNVFAIIGRVSKALKDNGNADKANTFSKKAMDCGSYEDVLTLVSEYVVVS